MEDTMDEKSLEARDVENRIQAVIEKKDALVQKGADKAIFGDFDSQMRSLKTSISRFIGYLVKSEEARDNQRWWLNFGNWELRFWRYVALMDSLLDSIETRLNNADAAFGNGDMDIVRSQIESIDYKRVADFHKDGESLVHLKY